MGVTYCWMSGPYRNESIIATKDRAKCPYRLVHACLIGFNILVDGNIKYMLEKVASESMCVNACESGTIREVNNVV